MAENKLFSDIDLSFIPHPATGDLVAKYDENAIKTSIRNLILTRHYERPFKSGLGSNITSLVFELEGPALDVMLEKEITNTIINFEPRVDVLEVNVVNRAELNAVDATIYFKIKNTDRPVQLDLVLRRTR